MQLETLHLINFKNYTETELDLSSRIHVMVGKNGSGKTNLLDSIHYLSLTRSAFAPSDQFCIRHGQQYFVIRGVISRQGLTHELSCSIRVGSKKSFREGGNEYQKLSEHIGKYPVVLIAPDDTELVKEGGEARRKFFDSVISQLDRSYLEALIQYGQALKHRNSLLKMFAETNIFDAVALESFDRLLVQNGTIIFEKRQAFIQDFLPVFKRYYHFIVDNEPADIVYHTELHNYGSFEEGLAASRQRDRVLQRTSFGVHRDDFRFTFGEGDLKRLGSQGQQKSFIIALKLAQFDIIKQQKSIKPILLLDDIFDKLDDDRIARLLGLIKDDELGQLFITDARPDRTRSLLRSVQVAATAWKVDSGTVVKM